MLTETDTKHYPIKKALEFIKAQILKITLKSRKWVLL